jgi:hypothetical protein
MANEILSDGEIGTQTPLSEFQDESPDDIQLDMEEGEMIKVENQSSSMEDFDHNDEADDED